MPRLGTEADLARELGKSRQAVAQGHAKGRVTYHDPDRRLYDLDQAAHDWHAYSERHRLLPNAGSGRQAGDRAGMAELLLARIARERAEAKLAEIKLAEQEGRLCRADGVRRTAFMAFRAVRDGLQNLSPRLAAPLSAISDPAECGRVIDIEVRAILEALARNPPMTTAAEWRAHLATAQAALAGDAEALAILGREYAELIAVALEFHQREDKNDDATQAD